MARREDFAALAQENAGGLAQIGYFTTIKIAGKAVDFGTVTDYWMEERPDHLVTFHVVMPLKEPTPPGKYFSFLVADPDFFIDFEYDATEGVKLDNPPSGCSLSVAKPKSLEPDEKAKLTESYFSGLAIGSNFGFKMASRAIIACP